MIRNHNKYVVLKVDDIMTTLNDEELANLQHIVERIETQRAILKKQSKKYVVVAEDWPMYEQTWKAIEDWVEGKDHVR